MFTVRFVSTGGNGIPQDVELHDGDTVATLLDKQGLDAGSVVCRVNGQTATTTTQLSQGDSVTVSNKNLKGA